MKFECIIPNKNRNAPVKLGKTIVKPYRRFAWFPVHMHNQIGENESIMTKKCVWLEYVITSVRETVVD